MSTVTRLDQTFADLKAQGRKALIPFITAGDPYPEKSVELMLAMAEAGADVIELGVPFSDPMADGPVIQKAAERAIQLVGIFSVNLGIQHAMMVNRRVGTFCRCFRLNRPKQQSRGDAAALGQALQGGAQLLQDVLLPVLAVAVGGFDQHGVGLGWRLRRVHDQVVRTAQVAREQNAPPAHFQQHAGRAQDMPGRRKGDAPAGNRLKRLVERMGAELLHAMLRIEPRVERQRRCVLRELVAVEEGGVFFLQITAVG